MLNFAPLGMMHNYYKNVYMYAYNRDSKWYLTADIAVNKLCLVENRGV